MGSRKVCNDRLELGYLAAHPDIVKAVQKFKAKKLLLLLLFLKHRTSGLHNDLHEVHAMRDEFSNEDFMVSSLNAIDGVECFTPGGAFYVFKYFDI